MIPTRRRVVGLFDLANRIVALAGKNEPIIPQNLHDITVIGKGTAEDRAWVFAELLRQAGIDAVILKPRPPAADHARTGSSNAGTASAKTGNVGKSAAAVVRLQRVGRGAALARGRLGRQAGLPV